LNLEISTSVEFTQLQYALTLPFDIGVKMSHFSSQSGSNIFAILRLPLFFVKRHSHKELRLIHNTVVERIIGRFY